MVSLLYPDCKTTKTFIHLARDQDILVIILFVVVLNSCSRWMEYLMDRLVGFVKIFSL